MATRAKTKRGAAPKRPPSLGGAVRKAARQQRKTVEEANERVLNGMKELVAAQLGLYGEIYDEIDGRLAKLRAGTPKRWQKLVTRGEKMQRDIQKAREELLQNLEKSRWDLQKRLDRAQADLRSRLGKLRSD